MKFPNKVIEDAYNKAKGLTFTWSPTRQIFEDEFGNTDYNYSAMIWLKEARYLKAMPYDRDAKTIVTKFQIVR